MSLFNQLIPSYTLNDKRQIRVAPQMQEPVYIDDAFDPLFNKRAQAYLNAKYGRFLRIPGGYAEMIENMLGNSTKQWGPLGPGMGILGTFGRTIDKAEDFLLGGITEASHLGGNLNPLGSYTPVKNPLREVFVEDKDYSGQKLMASMANNMSKLAGDAHLTENDFTGAWNVPALGIEIATDPGILGGALSRHLSTPVGLTDIEGNIKIVPLQKAAQNGAISSKEIMDMLANETNIKSAVGEAGQLMSNFDDVLTKLSWDITSPGLRLGLKKLTGKLKNLTGGEDISAYVNSKIKEAKEIQEAKELIDNYDNIKDTSKITRANIKTTKNVSNPDMLKSLIDDYDNFINSPEGFDSFAQASITEKIDKIINEFSNIDVSTREQTFIRQVLSDIEKVDPNLDNINNKTVSEILTNYLENGTEIPDIYKQAISDNVLRLTENDNNIIETLKELKNQLKTKAYTDYNASFVSDLQNLIELSKASEKDQIQSMLDFKNKISSYTRVHDIDDYISKNGWKFPDVEIPEDLRKEVEDKVYKEMLESSENYVGDDINEVVKIWDKNKQKYVETTAFRKNILTPGTRENSLFKKKVLEELTLDQNIPVIISGNRFRIIQDYIQKTGYMPYTKKKLNEFIAIVSNGDKKLASKMQKAIKNGNFVEFYELLAEDNSAFKPILEEYYNLDSKLSKYQENLQKDLAVKHNFPYLKEKDAGNSPVAYHTKLLDFLTSIFKVDELSEDIQFALKNGLTEKSSALDYAIKNNLKYKNYGLIETINTINDSKLTKAQLRTIYDGFKELRELYDVVNLIEIGSKDDILNQTAKAYTDELKMFRTHLNKDPFLVIGKDGERGFNIDLYYHLKKSFPYHNVELVDSMLKNYNTSVSEVEAKLKEAYPFLDTYSKSISDTKNTMYTLYDILDSDGTPKGVTQFISDEKERNKIISSFKNKEKIDKYFENKYEAFTNALANTDAKNFENILTEDINPNYIKAKEALAEFTGYSIDEIDNKLDEIRKTVQENSEEARLFTKFNIITNNVINLDKHKDSFATIRYFKDRLQKIQDYKYNFKQQYLRLHPNAKAEEIAKVWEEHGSKLLALRDKSLGDVIPKDKFIREFINAKGLLVGKVKVGEAEDLVNAIYNNARVINSNVNLVTPFKFQDKDTLYVGLYLNPNKDTIKQFQKSVDINNFDKLQDIIFAKPEEVHLPKDLIELNDMLNNVNNGAANMYKTMGFENATTKYNKHKYTFSESSKAVMHNLYNNFGIKNIDDVRSCADIIQKMYNEHGSFMTFETAKSLRGNIASWNKLADIFDTDIDRVAKATLTDGIFEEHKVQMFVDLCLNDNTKVSSYANDWKQLKDIINAKDIYGQSSGNLKNMVLASAIYDEETGAFKRFKKYDIYTDKGIQEAFENNAFYIPTTMFAAMDKMVKKDAKMSNKVYAFINKYLMLPFKFGTLANPGFLVGNFSDAYMKQAISLSRKYGTSVAEEMANVSASIMDILTLNKNWDEIYRNKFLPTLSEQTIKSNPFYKISSKAFDDVEISEHFNTWYQLNKQTLTKFERDNIELMLYINKYIPTMTGDLKSIDIENISQYIKGNKFEQPKSFVEKRLMGNHYDPHNITTWGIFAGNPISSAVMKYSGDIETLFRSASVLNDLKHVYKDKASLIATIGLDPSEYAKRHKELTAKTLDAINLMNAANFNYDNVSEFMQKISYVMPFPTFYLKNLSYWLEIINENPEIIDTIVNTQNTMWHGIDTTKDNFQAEAKGRGSLPTSSIIGQKPSKVLKGVLKPTMTNSMFSAFSTINNPLKDIANRVNPITSPITRHLQEPENVRYRPYSTDPYEKNIKQGDKNFNKLTYTFHRLNPYDRFLNTYLRTPAKIKTNQAQLSDFIPSVFQPDYSRKSTSKK